MALHVDVRRVLSAELAQDGDVWAARPIEESRQRQEDRDHEADQDGRRDDPDEGGDREEEVRPPPPIPAQLARR
jgi:hypothetical protein